MTEQTLRRPTVAIVGSHPRTRAEFDFERTDCDIWTFNEALGDPKQEWCSRADAVFQIHKPVIFRSVTNRNHAGHYEWLKSTDVPVIMQEAYEDVPASEAYPLDEVLALTPGFRYLTSSVAEAIALAIHKGYKRIEIYGAEMETNTEYGHQRQGMAFWIGVAVGKGIEVIHRSDTFWNQPLYGYEGNTRVEMDHYRQRIAALSDKRAEVEAKHTGFVGAINNLISNFIKDYKTDQSQLDALITQAGQTAHDFGMIDGALQSNEQYLDRCMVMQEESGDYIIVRQEIEGKAYAGHKEKTERLNQTHVRSDRLSKARQKLMTNANAEIRKGLANEFGAKLADYIKMCTWAGMGSGIMHENMMLLQAYDTLTRAMGGQVEVKEEPEQTLETEWQADAKVLEDELDAIEAIS
jgi:hypothetical protein